MDTDPEEPKKSHGLSETMRNLIREYLAKLEADNERKCAERNALRWKSQRDPEDYERQKERQRQEYAEAQGGSVRPYSKIEASSVSEHKEKALARDADRQKRRYEDMSPADRQAKSDRAADEAWIARRQKRGMSDEEINSALAARIVERNARRAASLQRDPDENPS
ncbi:hypothetical protein HUK65_15540 [Rhodobacteraceae bacterium 2376]|uniref:Uncharacterized protein n=1 Tax=Rhabdonatronobacter sediminivivens TaxID=2743469 RepID=A0A7Z0I2M6_9RHOB|nr:hypothetical protein [Rhabdonatronobacter sediminivivens]NYS26399.1 hypothetical protein [Rhabdonatronobacter sediminivivens]